MRAVGLDADILEYDFLDSSNFIVHRMHQVHWVCTYHHLQMTRRKKTNKNKLFTEPGL